MFFLIKLIIWIAGMTVVGFFVLEHIGYDVNMNYWNDRKAACQERITQCRKDLIKTGFEGAKEKCDFKCVDPKLLIEKK